MEQITNNDDKKSFGPFLRMKGLLFDAEKFYLVHAFNINIENVEIWNWNTDGSKEALSNFFAVTSEWHKALNVIRLDDYELDVKTDDGQCCYMGRGAFARVFRVNRSADVNSALKVVICSNIANTSGMSN